ncbi:MAG: alanine racemase, partial [Pseudomonadota bacterium]
MTGPVARINLDALRHNLSRVRELTPGCPVAVAIKANAYGHGLTESALALADADAYAVARVEEGLRLRREGIIKKIIVLEGFASQAELRLSHERDFELVIHDLSQVAQLEAYCASLRTPRELRDHQGFALWLKIDTGMNRLGFPPEESATLIARLGQLPNVTLVGVMTHMANADDRDSSYTQQQLERFKPCIDPELQQSIANSACLLNMPLTRTGLVRPGIMLYGASPFSDTTAADEGLQPVMTLRTHLIAVHRLKKGDVVGYGSTWRCPEDMQVGVAAIGYGDGYPRHAPNGTPVLVDGRRVALAGRVSMDMVTIDLRQVAGARVGSSVVLWGEGLPVEEVASAAGTISYELFCRLTTRVKFRYEGKGLIDQVATFQ